MRLRDILAVVIALLAGVGLVFMWVGETQVVETAKYQQTLAGLVQYCKGLGIVFLGASIAYILLGHEEKVSTTIEDIEAANKK